MKLKQKLITLLGINQKEPEKKENIEVTEDTSLHDELKLLRVLLFGKDTKDIPPGVLKRLVEQNQKIYWAVKDDESGLTVIEALKDIMNDKSPREKKKVLSTIKKNLNTEIAAVNTEITSEKIMDVLDKHKRLTAADIAIYASASKTAVLRAVKNLVEQGKIKEKKDYKETFFEKI